MGWSRKLCGLLLSAAILFHAARSLLRAVPESRGSTRSTYLGVSFEWVFCLTCQVLTDVCDPSWCECHILPSKRNAVRGAVFQLLPLRVRIEATFKRNVEEKRESMVCFIRDKSCVEAFGPLSSGVRKLVVGLGRSMRLQRPERGPLNSGRINIVNHRDE